MKCIQENGDAEVIVTLSKEGEPCTKCTVRQWQACMMNSEKWLSEAFPDDESTKAISKLIQFKVMKEEEQGKPL